MKNNKIREALDSVQPSDVQKERMRSILRAQLQEETGGNREYTQRADPARRGTWIPAAAVLAVIVLLGGFLIAGINGGTGKMSAYEDPIPEETPESLGELVDSKLLQAAAEWNAYLDEMESAEAEAMTDPYGLYGCKNEEMIQELKVLCAAYDLDIVGDYVGIYDYELLMDIVWVDAVCREKQGVTWDQSSSGYYSDGCFALTGTVTMDASCSSWNYPVDFGFYRIMNSTFHNALADVGDLEQYERWEYTTGNGVELLLALSEDQALILANREDSLILVTTRSNRVGDLLYGEQAMNREEMEAFAEVFDFTLGPDGGLSPIPDPKAVAKEQLSVYTSPVSGAAQIGQLPKDTELILQKREWINNKEWAYISQIDTEGWVDMDFVELTYTTRDNTVAAEDKLKDPTCTECYAEYVERVCSTAESLDNRYYTIYDMNGDRVDDLLLGAGTEGKFTEIVTIKDGEPVSLYSPGSDFYVYENHIVGDLVERDGLTIYGFYRLEGIGYIRAEYIIYNSAEKTWGSSLDGDYELDQSLTEADAKGIMDSYQRVEPETAPITEFPLT